MSEITVQFVNSVDDIGLSIWERLCGKDYPFLRYEFLAALEHSGCTTSQVGWQPHHLTVLKDEELIVVMPLYIKTDSYGEYVFDWAWADAYHRYGLNYYPKLITAIPFTPATGPRIGFSYQNINFNKDSDSEIEIDKEIISLIVENIKKETKRLNASSWHCLFPENFLCESLENEDIHPRKGCQFHWLNKNYQSFEDFISTFNSRKRKTLKKERQAVLNQNIKLKRKTGEEISEEEWALFYQFYHLTYFKRSGRQGYLNEIFFKQLAATMPEQIMMVIAYSLEHEEESMIAASLFFVGEDTLYGRYWGCAEECEFLHFEACYYQGIEYAIEKKLKRFDPGAQGEHKIQRGFTPVATWSNHWLSRENFQVAINDFLEKETEGVDNYIQDCKTYLPFKTD